jgi:hypothetical protein
MGNRKLAKLVWGYIKTLNITFNWIIYEFLVWIFCKWLKQTLSF